MSFSTDLADLVAAQLSRLTTLNRHQLAGQAANLDFWLAQARHALAVIDGYGERFARLSVAQEGYVSAHGTVEFSLGVDYPTKNRAAPPRRVPDRELRQARRALAEAATRFLERCRSEGLVSEAEFAEASSDLSIE